MIAALARCCAGGDPAALGSLHAALVGADVERELDDLALDPETRAALLIWSAWETHALPLPDPTVLAARLVPILVTAAKLEAR